MKAMILCGGYGKRLGISVSLTRELPKPIVPLGVEPLLAHALCYLSYWAFTDIVINLHYRPLTIPSYFGTGSAYGGGGISCNREESLLAASRIFNRKIARRD
jgi:N-acetyl-alpha-D-muramate 1-phosphate uridylyltransferase